jgi:hypothetical protein
LGAVRRLLSPVACLLSPSLIQAPLDAGALGIDDVLKLLFDLV